MRRGASFAVNFNSFRILARLSETLGPQMQIKFASHPSYCQQLHLHRSAPEMTSVSETTCTLRYELQSREIYIEEPITSPAILLEHPQTQDEIINSIQETPNSQFRLVLSVTPCMPHTSRLEFVNDSILYIPSTI